MAIAFTVEENPTIDHEATLRVGRKSKLRSAGKN
jgi:hypothetical protein